MRSEQLAQERRQQRSDQALAPDTSIVDELKKLRYTGKLSCEMPASAVLAEVFLALRLRGVATLIGDGCRVAMHTAHIVRPAQRADGVVALRIVDQALNVQHRVRIRSVGASERRGSFTNRPCNRQLLVRAPPSPLPLRARAKRCSAL